MYWFIKSCPSSLSYHADLFTKDLEEGMFSLFFCFYFVNYILIASLHIH